MSIFSYTALDGENKYTRGTVQSKNQKVALADLESQGLLVVSLDKQRNSKFTKLLEISTVRRLDKILFTRHLHTLIESGIALDEALKISSDQSTNPKLKSILLDLHNRVKKGQAFHTALAYHKKYFTDFFINLVKVGESSGTLESVLEHLLEQQEQDYELITKTRGAMIYPAVIVVAAIMIVIMMMVFVIPTITDLLKEYDVELPLATKILIFITDAVNDYGLIIATVFLLMIVGLYRYVKTPRGKGAWDLFKLRMPVLKNIVKEFNLARFCRSMSALLKSGISVDEALILTASICSNVYYKESIENSVGFVRKGIPLTEVLNGRKDLYPSITTKMLEVGEKTGKFDHMFTKLAIYYEKSVLNTINNLSSIIEPVMLLAIGFGVGFVAISILTPIWKFAQTV